MSIDTKNDVRSTMFNLPNQLTSLRLILSVALFCLIAYKWYLAALILFLVAVATDWLDGWYARKYGQVTVLGRILDPFADKVFICGTFIFLVGVPDATGLRDMLRPWMVVVIVGREMLVTALRSHLEQQGADFSANVAGKLKMVLQCVAAGLALFYLYWVGYDVPVDAPRWLTWPLIATIWGTVLMTVFSGAIYVRQTIALLNR